MLKQTIPEILAISQRVLLGEFYVCCFWGKQHHLEQLTQYYAVEKTKSEARKRGHSVTERQLEDGSIKIQILAGA